MNMQMSYKYHKQGLLTPLVSYQLTIVYERNLDTEYFIKSKLIGEIINDTYNSLKGQTNENFLEHFLQSLYASLEEDLYVNSIHMKLVWTSNESLEGAYVR